MLDQLRLSFRALRARPSFSLFAVLALALGIGANAALFAVLNSYLLRPLPYRNVHEIVEITGARFAGAIESLDKATSFRGVAAFTPRNFLVRGEQATRRTYGLRVTENLFDVLGVEAAVGRTPAARDSTQPVVLLSYDYWRRVSGSPDIIGQTIEIAEDQPRTIIGVLPADFTLQVRDASLFVPVPATSINDPRVVARLGEGVQARQAEQQAAAIVGALDAPTRSDAPVRVIPITEGFRPGGAGAVWLFQSAVGLVLLITCANLANLLLVHGSGRRREFAIRAAIGAGRARLFSQLMTENLLVALAGGALGLLLASASLDFIRAVLPANITRMLRGADGLSIDGHVVAFTFGLSLLTILLFGLAPAAGILRFDLMSSLRSAARGAAAGRQRLGGILVAAEVGLALMLLIAAGLTLKSLMGLAAQDLGFTGDRVLRTAVDLPPSRYPSLDQRIQALNEFLDRVRQLPGVESPALVGPQLYPFAGPSVRGAIFSIPDRPAAEPRADFFHATPDYLRTLQIPLLRGRWFTARDVASSQPVAVLSDVVAKRYWPGEDPLGKQVRQNPRDPASPIAVIVGVVGNVRNPIGADFSPLVYRPLTQSDVSGATVMVRTSGNPLSLSSAVYSQIRAADPNAVEFRATELASEVTSYISPQRFSASVFGIFALVGLLLAAVGIFAVTRHWVSIRVPEIGVRMALGASGAQVLRYVLKHAAISAALGVAAGLAGAYALQRYIASQLYGVHPLDPLVFLSVSALVALVSIASALLPAFRASRVDPVIALRQE